MQYLKGKKNINFNHKRDTFFFLGKEIFGIKGEK